jgi:hypothetical protein
MMKKTTNGLSQMISNKKQNNPKSLKQTKWNRAQSTL